MLKLLVTCVVIASVVAPNAPTAPSPAPAGPSVMVFETAPGVRVLMPEFSENMRFLGELTTGLVKSSDTVGVRGIEVAMFYARSSAWTNRPVAEIPFAMADMRARYYPARGDRPALFLSTRRVTLMNGGRSGGYPPIVTPAALEILARRGVPTTAASTAASTAA